MCALSVISGDRHSDHKPLTCDTIGASIRRALAGGFMIGRRVRMGRVGGTVIGFNIASHGRYYGAHYPLLVQTRFGVAKCRIDELSLA